MEIGKIYLVGAGPGDPGLITQKGLECLARADVIIYDHLIDERLLDATLPAAEKIYAGKTYNEHDKEQPEINELLVSKAREGKTVVRLKGGDPFVLGRGGEEAEVLSSHDIPFEIVPGISSAVAVPAYAGIPVTHRQLASSFAVITGHEDPRKENSSIRWDKLSTGTDTLIFLMGMHNIAEIAARLMESGRPAETPVAVIKNGTLLQQQTVVGTLKDIVKKAKDSQLGPPAVIVVGDVVRLREKLRWFDNRPLWGKHILVTRAHRQAGAISRLLAEYGAQPVELPSIDIQPLYDYQEMDLAISDLPQYQWLIFTSVNGVEPFFGRLHEQKLDARALKGLKIGAIGPATAGALEKEGIIPDFCPKVYTSRGLITGLKGINVSGQSFLLVRADIADKELTEGLTVLGAKVREVSAYRNVPAIKSLDRVKKMLTGHEIDVITFTSSSTFSNLMMVLGKNKIALNGAKIACIGPKTAETVRKAGFQVDIIASEATIKGLVEAIKEYFSIKSKR